MPRRDDDAIRIATLYVGLQHLAQELEDASVSLSDAALFLDRSATAASRVSAGLVTDFRTKARWLRRASARARGVARMARPAERSETLPGKGGESSA